MLIDYSSSTGKTGIHLTDLHKMIDELLPIEREQMEKIGIDCYNEGTEDQYHGEYRHKFSDYFNQNYTQDGK